MFNEDYDSAPNIYSDFPMQLRQVYKPNSKIPMILSWFADLALWGKAKNGLLSQSLKYKFIASFCSWPLTPRIFPNVRGQMDIIQTEKRPKST